MDFVVDTATLSTALFEPRVIWTVWGVIVLKDGDITVEPTQPISLNSASESI